MRSVPVSSVLMMLLYLAAGGCARFSQDEAVPPQAAAPLPEGKRLTELVATAFATAKLAGAPEVSEVRAAHDSQWGDWVFCIRSGNAGQSPKYAVLIGHDAILEVRSSVLIDGCDNETYHPLAAKDQNSKPGGKQSRRH